MKQPVHTQRSVKSKKLRFGCFAKQPSLASQLRNIKGNHTAVAKHSTIKAYG
jgi:hypothetical protein